LIERLAVLTCLLLLSGCGDPIGTTCDFQGSGFTAKDNCRHRCLEHRRIECPDGTAIQGLKICSGSRQCNPGNCPDDQACYHVADPFKKESYCLPVDICGELSAEQAMLWESSSKAKSDELIEKWKAKKRKLQQTKPAPAAEALPPDE